MEPTTLVLGGTLVAVVSGTVGRVWRNNSKVEDSLCEERRSHCTALIIEKVDNLAIAVNDLKDTINKKQTV